MFLTADWFNGIDLIFELVGFMVALLIAGYSLKSYKISGEKRFQYFSLAFILISLSLFMKVITSSAVYFEQARMVADVLIRPALGSGREYSTLFYNAGFFLEMASMLGGWLLLFFVSQKARGRLRKYYELSQMGLFVYLVLLISWIANFKNVAFYLTGTVLLSLIVLNYYKNYLNNGNKNTLLVMNSFVLMFIGNLLFVFMTVIPLLYVLGQIFLLMGFILLLYTYMKVRRK
ncbi:MAG: hypothetical protein ABIH82_03075 [Candidatus Woesearchaeota archaeon]